MPAFLRETIRTLRTVLFLLAFAVAARGQEKGDLKKLAGVWHVVAIEFNGRPTPREILLDQKETLTVTGNRFVYEAQHPDGKRLWTGTATLDESARPKRFDWVGTGPKGGAIDRIGLYELSDYELKTVTVQRDIKKDAPIPRPKAFTTAENNNHAVVTYRRHPLGSTPVFPKQPPAYRLQSTPTHRIEAVLATEFRCPKLTVEEWSIHALKLLEFPGQKNVLTEMDLAGKATTDLSDHKRPMLSLRVPVKGKALKNGIKIRTTYRADLFKRELIPLKPGAKPPAVPELSDAERKRALASTDLVNFEEPSFQAWLDKHALRPRAKESDVEFARRVFLAIRKNLTYFMDPTDKRDAAAVCKAGKAACSGMSNLYVAALRANGIPARVLCGRHARPGDKSAPLKLDKLETPDYGGQHATAEFYAHGVGWVPADMSFNIVYGKSTSGLDFFGSDQGGFLILHIDDNIIFDSPDFGRQTIEGMDSPIALGRGSGSHDDMKRVETWQVRKRP